MSYRESLEGFHFDTWKMLTPAAVLSPSAGKDTIIAILEPQFNAIAGP
jgi:hypothetical protein